MKKILLVLLLTLVYFCSCQKDKSALPTTDTLTTPGGTTNPPVQPSGHLAITGVAPASGLPNTLVTISGSGFGTSASDVTVLFNGIKGSVQTVTPTEIKVLVPATVTGYLAVLVGSQSVSAGTFTYILPELTTAYVSGDVTLRSQADVNAFVALNKGKKLQITGSLFLGAANVVTNPNNDITSVAGLSIINSITGQLFCYKINLPDADFFHSLTAVSSITMNNCSFTALDFSQINSFSRSFSLSSLSALKEVKINLAPDMPGISISGCPQLSDLSFLSNLTSATSFSLSTTGASALSLDKLTTVATNFYISGNGNLTSLSCPALTATVNMTLSNDAKLTTLNFPALTMMSGKLTLYGIKIDNLSGFGALQTLGALQLYNNPLLVNLHGLEKLTSLTMTGVLTNSIAGNSPISRVNGIYISNNAKLVSISGLQNVTSIPIAYLTNNPLLTDLCSFKQSILALSKAASFSYTYRDQIDYYRTATIPALTLTNNGNYTTTQDALVAVMQCR